MTKSKTAEPAGTSLVVLSALVLLALVLPQTLFFLFLLAYLVVVFRGEGVLNPLPERIISTGRGSDPARSPPC